MRDRPVIWSGLLIFLALLTLPVWHNLSAHITTKGPQPVLPRDQKQCVASLEYMKTSHMKLLLTWRDDVVRNGARDYISPDGRRFTMNLTETCLRQCHTDRAAFCDRCHTYAAVSPSCWDCHLDTKGLLRSSR